MWNYNYYVYILTSNNGRAMYIGFSNNLERRIQEHKSGLIEGFTKKYNVHRLVYYEYFEDASAAIAREKELKGWKRERKNALVESVNPEWKEILLSEEYT